jgi:hypothetical protein
MVGHRTINGRGRRMDSLENRTNTMGGVKKPGIPSTVGLDASVSGVYRKKVGCPCPFIISMTRSCGVTVGGRTVKPRC